MTPSELVAFLGLSPSLASAQFAVLSRAGLVSRVRRGKTLRCRAEIGRLDVLVRYLVEDCCRGRPALCSIPTEPGAVVPFEASGHDVAPLRAKRLDEFLGDGAPVMDFVFTVCDRAADEECASWPGGPVTAHWGIPDPLAARDAEAGFGLALRTAFGALERRFATFAALPLESLDRMSLQREVDAIAGVDAAEVASA